MASKYTIRAEADFSKHDSQLKKSAAEVYKYQKQVEAAQKEIKDFGSGISDSVNGFKGLFDSLKGGDILGFVDGLGSVKGSLVSLIPTMGASSAAAGTMGVAFSTALGPISAIVAAVAAVGYVVVDSIKSFSEFETHLDSLQSLTGLDDTSMKGISEAAIDMSKDFKATASEVVDSMKLIGSQAPELLKDKDALLAVTEAANVLSEAALISVEDAAKGVTTVMNQMNVGASEATNIINTLAAASQQGAADVAYLNTAFEKAGTAASSAGLNYVELAAMVETVAPKFSSADVAGSALSSTLLALSVQANDEFKPAVVGLEQALDNLAAAEMNDAEMKNLVGASNITMLKTLLDGKNTLSDYTTSLSGTNTAYDQMNTNNSNLQGTLTKLSSAWDGFILSLGESSVIQGLIEALGFCVDIITYLIDSVDELLGCFDGFKVVEESGISLSTILDGLKAVVVILVEYVKIRIAEFIAYFKFLHNTIFTISSKIWEFIKKGFDEIMNLFKKFNIHEPIKNSFNKVIEFIRNALTKIWEYYNKYRKAIGLEEQKIGDFFVGGNKKTEATYKVKKETETKKKITTSSLSLDNKAPSLSSGSSTKGKKGNATKKAASGTETKTTRTEQVKVEADKGSIKDLQNQLSNITDELNTKDVSTERLEILLKEKKALEDSIEALQIRNGLKEAPKVEVKPIIPENSIKAIKDKISSTQAELEITAYGSSEYYRIIELLNNLKAEEHILKLKVEEDGLSETERKAKDLESKVKKLDTTSQTIGDFGSSFSSLGKSLELPELDAAGIVASGIASVIQGYGKAVSGAAAMGPFGWIAFALAGAATMATVISQIKSLKGFDSGGIISGARTIGDYNLARVNSGEMILNSSQQGKLFNVLNGVGGFDTGNNVSGAVNFRIQGNDLVGVLNNYTKKRNKVL